MKIPFATIGRVLGIVVLLSGLPLVIKRAPASIYPAKVALNTCTAEEGCCFSPGNLCAIGPVFETDYIKGSACIE